MLASFIHSRTSFDLCFGSLSYRKNHVCPSFNHVSCGFEVRLKNLEVVLPLHHCTYFVQCFSTTCSKTTPQHDGTTTMLGRWYSVPNFESTNFTPPNILATLLDCSYLS
ncbi:hypothetical protein AMECASPLE_009077 [Ameca splendens]|uniref:Uncharacterized protein n=1 Tax=Ameca splendens TaxID=208324 RepID=A0ABV0Z9V6_9TELE